jgi:hypothetical protein
MYKYEVKIQSENTEDKLQVSATVEVRADTPAEAIEQAKSKSGIHYDNAIDYISVKRLV